MAVVTWLDTVLMGRADLDGGRNFVKG